ncbi:hypothetical protein [Alteribacillus sp. HJP-4]|uniref:hypothetical protein n=1 Tax=Alteribacillus sp. HJP-4 TaxID=2775394 RepID=UPI0035CD3A1D
MYNNRNNQQKLPPYTIDDLFKGGNLDIIAAVLLLTGKLKVDSVEVYRSDPAVNVRLVGEFLSRSSKADKMSKFLKENGDMTVDDILEAIRNRM